MFEQTILQQSAFADEMDMRVREFVEGVKFEEDFSLIFLETGYGVPPDKIDKVITNFIHEKAESGCPIYQVVLGLFILFSNDDLDAEHLCSQTAFNLFEHAHKECYIPGTYYMGVCYTEGKGGVAKDGEKGLSYLDLAHSQGYLRATNKLAEVLYSEEDYDSPQSKRAKKLWEYAASKGYAPAMLHLGDFYSWDDLDLGCVWYRKAIVAGLWFDGGRRLDLIRREYSVKAIRPVGDWHPLLHRFCDAHMKSQIMTIMLMVYNPNTLFHQLPKCVVINILIPYILAAPEFEELGEIMLNISAPALGRLERLIWNQTLELRKFAPLLQQQFKS